LWACLGRIGTSARAVTAIQTTPDLQEFVEVNLTVAVRIQAGHELVGDTFIFVSHPLPKLVLA
jgi:hypothetical protein